MDFLGSLQNVAGNLIDTATPALERGLSKKLNLPYQDDSENYTPMPAQPNVRAIAPSQNEANIGNPLPSQPNPSFGSQVNKPVDYPKIAMIGGGVVVGLFFLAAMSKALK